MNRIKSYKLFLEEAEFDVQSTDTPDIKTAKEELSKLKKQIIDFNTKKPLVDNAYLKSSTDADLQAKVDQIVGKTGTDRNPFLVDYLHVASLKRKVDKTQKDITTDKLKKDDFTQEMNLSTESSVKQMVSAKITDITNRISTKTAEIVSLSKEIADSEASLKKKMIDVEKNMMDNIKKIASNTSK